MSVGSKYRPSLAELACNGDYYAVLNLIRRKVVVESEACTKFLGRNVAEWAEFHGKFNIRGELLYRFVSTHELLFVSEKTMS